MPAISLAALLLAPASPTAECLRAAARCPSQPKRCEAPDAGLKVPAGFCARLVVADLKGVRHIAIAPNGDIVAAHNRRGLVLLRDADRDGTAEAQHWLVEGAGGSGVLLTADAIYFATNDSVLRVPFRPGATEPSGPVETVARGLPIGGHAAKGLTLGKDGALYVSFGSRSNSCQRSEHDRKGPHPAPNPCPELEIRAGIWRFDSRRIGQTPADAKRHTTGLRNPMAMAVEPTTGTLYTASHGRDALTENWKWPAEAGRENPAEEFGPAPAGGRYGWPYCYFDPRRKLMLQSPEYGGDGAKVGNCGEFLAPAIGFPAHWAPNALHFYSGASFPAQYRGGAFLAFHGSWNRAPAPQQGYRVVFIPFKNGRPTGGWSDFALPSGAPTSIRPTGLATGPDGALYISDGQNGRIWKVTH